MESIKGDKVKYIAIELVLHPDKLEKSKAGMDDLIEYGLFKGMRKIAAPQSEQEFMLVVPPKDKSIMKLFDDKSMKAYARDAYNVLSFEVFDGTIRHICFFKADDEDQKEADRIIKLIMTAMLEADKMTNDAGIIDVTKYTDLPEQFRDPVKKTVTHMNQIQGSRSVPAGQGHATNYTAGWNGRPIVPAVDYSRKPFFYRRKSALPHHATLKKLSTLLDKVNGDDYVEPEWPIIEKEVAALETTNATGEPPDLEDDVTNMWQGCC